LSNRTKPFFAALRPGDCADPKGHPERAQRVEGLSWARRSERSESKPSRRKGLTISRYIE